MPSWTLPSLNRVVDVVPWIQAMGGNDERETNSTIGLRLRSTPVP